MPHKTKNGECRWGNLVRKTKQELIRVVYGIWKKNGGKGDFKKFWKEGKLNEDVHSDSQRNLNN